MSGDQSDMAYRESLMRLIRRLAEVARTLKRFDEESAQDPWSATIPHFEGLTPNGTREVDTVANTITVALNVTRRYADRLRTVSPDDSFVGPEDANAFRRVTVISCDLPRLGNLMQQSDPDSAFDAFSRYAALADRVVADNHGRVHRMTPTTFLGVFGLQDDDEHPNAAYNAVHCGLSLLAALDQFNTWQRRIGAVPLRVGIGIHTGPALVGRIRVDDRDVAGIAGEPVRVAMGLHALADRGNRPLLISGETAHELAGRVETVLHDDVTIASDGDDLTVYRVESMPPHVDYGSLLDELFPEDEIVDKQDPFDT